MKFLLRLVSILTAAAVMAALMTGVSYADTLNGIAVSSSALHPGDKFTVTLTVPPAEDADTVSVRAEFDPAAFEVISWSPDISNSLSNYGEGFFVVSSSNVSRAIKLGSGLTMKAQLSVKQNAVPGTYAVKLARSSISYVSDDGITSVELWKPAVTQVSIKITASSPAAGIGSTDTADTAQNVPANIPTGGSGIKNTNTAGTTVHDSPIPIDNEETEIPVDDEQEENAPESTGNAGASKISLSNSLAGLSGGKIRLTTQSDFFDNDSVITLSQSDAAEKTAAFALESLGMNGHGCYPFDIGIYEKQSGKTIDSLDGGFIEITMPIPQMFEKAADRLSVYHIVGGFPQLIRSSITIEEGTFRLTFRTNSFSPYMIVDTVGAPAVTGDNADTYGKPAGAGDNADTYVKPLGTAPANTGNSGGRPLNPNTGGVIVAAIAVPGAAAGCMILARKQIKRRKRTKGKGIE